MQLSKLLVTRWARIDGVWQECRELRDVSECHKIIFYSDEMRLEDSYIKSIEFIYEREDK